MYCSFLLSASSRRSFIKFLRFASYFLYIRTFSSPLSLSFLPIAKSKSKGRSPEPEGEEAKEKKRRKSKSAPTATEFPLDILRKDLEQDGKPEEEVKPPEVSWWKVSWRMV